jgi:WD40-like Beta Propeller Repeat.
MGDQVVFSSARGSKKKGVYKWNNQPYLDLYAVNKDKMGQADVSPFSSAINTQYHEASAAITESDRVLFFTRNNFYKNEYGKDGEGINRLQLFRAIKGTSTDWSDIKPVHFNSSEHSVAHPAVNAEGTRLYFASDMSGSIGESDLFVVDINADGSLGQPRNLGNIINTEGKESFPFINENGDLYYATKGIPGLGGYDIFVVRGMDEMLNTEGGLEALTEKASKM